MLRLENISYHVPTDGGKRDAILDDVSLNIPDGKYIVITGPTTLMMTLQIVEHLWQTERQNRNIRQIALKAGALYDKLVVMTDSVFEPHARVVR